MGRRTFGRRLLAVLIGACVLLPAGRAVAEEGRAGGARVPARRVGTSGAVPAATPTLAGTTAAGLAAAHHLGYQDGGTFVLLERGAFRVRLYPGTHDAMVAGDEYAVKDRIRRDGAHVLLSDRVGRFLSSRISEAQGRIAKEERERTEAEARERDRRRRADEELDRRLRERSIVPVVAQTPEPVAAPAAPAAVRGDTSWVPTSKEREWRWIVLHHSDDQAGCLRKYHEHHLNDRKWENGCGYHFVIGNGTQSGDGEVETGPRWSPQLQGAHAKTPDNRFNDHGIGICLVGDFHDGSGRPSAAQMDSLVRLCTWLMARYGIPQDQVLGHCNCGCSTHCPGENFPWSELRRRLPR
jgi:hypothetical protein